MNVKNLITELLELPHDANISIRSKTFELVVVCDGKEYKRIKMQSDEEFLPQVASVKVEKKNLELEAAELLGSLAWEMEAHDDPDESYLVVMPSGVNDDFNVEFSLKPIPGETDTMDVYRIGWCLTSWLQGDDLPVALMDIDVVKRMAEALKAGTAFPSGIDQAINSDERSNGVIIDFIPGFICKVYPSDFPTPTEAFNEQYFSDSLKAGG